MKFKQTIDKILEPFKGKPITNETLLELYQEVCKAFDEMAEKKIQIDEGYTNIAIMRTLCRQ